MSDVEQYYYHLNRINNIGKTEAQLKFAKEHNCLIQMNFADLESRYIENILDYNSLDVKMTYEYFKNLYIKEKSMKIVIPEHPGLPSQVLINDQKFVPEYEQRPFFFHLSSEEMKSMLEVQSVETLIKVSKACHGALYHKVRK
jgi:hypothetical protein